MSRGTVTNCFHQHQFTLQHNLPFDGQTCPSGSVCNFMKAPRYASSRQKSCQQCSNAKAKCDRKQESCTRCAQRGLSCVYRTRAALPRETLDGNRTVSGGAPSAAPLQDLSFPSPRSEPSITASGASFAEAVLPKSCWGLPNANCAESSEVLNFSSLDLACPIDVDAITNRWLNPYIPDPEQKVKEYPASVTRFIYRILKSYAGMAARGRGTIPFLHPVQIKHQRAGSPLTTCLSLVRIAENPLPGSEDSTALVLQREMESIAALRGSYDDMSLLAAFQAYLIYTMVLFFRLSQGPSSFFRGAMMNLQHLACSSSRRGLVCVAEERHARPKWEEWIVVEAKRRTLYVMYLLDSVLSAQENLPTFLGVELHGLPAPASKTLWEAQNRGDWEKEFNIFLAEWTERGLTIDELWPVPADYDEPAIARRQSRVDRWLESLDEYGTMMFAVTGCTHGGG